MDHIKQVSSHQDRNKMSTQSLAIIFGPLFTSTGDNEHLHKPIKVFKFLIEIWPLRRGRNLSEILFKNFASKVTKSW